MSGWRRPRKPVVSGERCPADRTSKVRDPRVTITEVTSRSREGTRTCGRCGRPDVAVSQSYGHRETAWYYESHVAP